MRANSFIEFLDVRYSNHIPQIYLMIDPLMYLNRRRRIRLTVKPFASLTMKTIRSFHCDPIGELNDSPALPQRKVTFHLSDVKLVEVCLHLIVNQ